MEEGIQTELGSALSGEETRGAPGPGCDADEESMSMGIRELVLGWGGESEPRDDDERLAALRRGRLKA